MAAAAAELKEQQLRRARKAEVQAGPANNASLHTAMEGDSEQVQQAQQAEQPQLAQQADKSVAAILHIRQQQLTRARQSGDRARPGSAAPEVAPLTVQEVAEPSQVQQPA